MTRDDILAGTVAACAPIAHLCPADPRQVGGGTLHHIATKGSDPFRDRSARDAAAPEFAALEAARLIRREVCAIITRYAGHHEHPDMEAWRYAEVALDKHVGRVEGHILRGQAADWVIPGYATQERRWQRRRPLLVG